MPDYQAMYEVLYNTVAGVIDKLQTAQKITEALYILEDDAVLALLTEEFGKEEKKGRLTAGEVTARLGLRTK